MLKRIQASKGNEDFSSDSSSDSDSHDEAVARNGVLVVPGRRLQGRSRHLLTDITKLIRHARKEQKVDTKKELSQISELCALHSCRLALIMEDRPTGTFMWMADTLGKSLRFEVVYFETFQELGSLGNFLANTRFTVMNMLGEDTHSRLVADIFDNVFNQADTNSSHCDKVLGLFEANGAIWIRFFEQTSAGLVEAGPRLTLRLNLILSDFLRGEVVYSTARSGQVQRADDD